MRRHRRKQNPPGGSKLLGFLGGMIGTGLVSGLVIEPTLKGSVDISQRALLNSGINLALSQATKMDAATQNIAEDTLTGARWSFYVGTGLGLLASVVLSGISVEDEKRIIAKANRTALEGISLAGCGCQACPCEQWSWPTQPPIQQSLSGTYLYGPYVGYAPPIPVDPRYALPRSY